MSVATLSIRRPLTMTLVVLGILLFGVAGYRRLSLIEEGNNLSIIIVSAVLPGASAETMESSVATPLEQQFSTLAGLDTMTSLNAIGSTEIELQFSPSRNIDTAAQDVQAMIIQTLPRLPPDMPTFSGVPEIQACRLTCARSASNHRQIDGNYHCPSSLLR